MIKGTIISYEKMVDGVVVTFDIDNKVQSLFFRRSVSHKDVIANLKGLIKESLKTSDAEIDAILSPLCGFNMTEEEAAKEKTGPVFLTMTSSTSGKTYQIEIDDTGAEPKLKITKPVSE